MRNKIDYGIDLGTTNSAIARMENGVPVIKKSGTLKDTFPSCIHFNKKQNVIVGDAAYNIMKTDNARALKTFRHFLRQSMPNATGANGSKRWRRIL